MKIAIGSDHAGLELKNKIISVLKEKGFDVVDHGTNGPESVDYPDYGVLVAEVVSQGKIKRGILVCGTGIGMSIVANKFPGVRAALCHDLYTAEMSRRHNDSNILILAGRTLSKKLALDIAETWLKTDFEGGRHQRRIDKITEIEKKVMKNVE